jgi:hypothetical protein
LLGSVIDDTLTPDRIGRKGFIGVEKISHITDMVLRDPGVSAQDFSGRGSKGLRADASDQGLRCWEESREEKKKGER